LISGGPLFGKRGPPGPPKSPRGRAFRFALPLDPIPQRPKRGHCDGPSLETPHSCPTEGRKARLAYFVTPTGARGGIGPTQRPAPTGWYQIQGGTRQRVRDAVSYGANRGTGGKIGPAQRPAPTGWYQIQGGTRQRVRDAVPYGANRGTGGNRAGTEAGPYRATPRGTVPFRALRSAPGTRKA